MCMALAVTEVVLNRFQVLPLLFPGMLCVRQRRFYFFNFDISDGPLGKTIRAEARMLIRATICVVLSYLWQHLVLETTQVVGGEFPTQMCKERQSCFASDFELQTIITREYQAIDCDGPQTGFQNRVVISCVRFIPPDSTLWLMHFGIAHSVTQLNFKCFELLVWIVGNSPRTRFAIGLLTALTILGSLVLFIGGNLFHVMSWLAFVLVFSVPIFLSTVWKSGKALEKLWKEDSLRAQMSIEEHLNAALSDIENEGHFESDHFEEKTVILKERRSLARASGRFAQLLSSGTRLFGKKTVASDASNTANTDTQVTPQSSTNEKNTDSIAEL